MCKVNYKNLKTGDMVFTTGRGVFSRAIKTVTDSDVTHVGLVVNVYGFKFIFEMLKDGLDISSFKRYMGTDRRSIVKVCRPSKLTDMGRQELRKKLLTDFLKEIDYDWGGVVKFIFKRLGRNRKNLMYCSEHVFTRINGVVGTYNSTGPIQVSPGELASGEVFDMVEVDWVLG